MDMFQDTDSGYVARSSFDNQGMNPTKEEVIARYPNAMILKSYVAFNLIGAINDALNGEELNDEERRILTIVNNEFLSNMIYVDALATEIAYYDFMHIRNKLSHCTSLAAQAYISEVYDSLSLAKSAAISHPSAYYKLLDATKNESEDVGFGGRR